MTPFTYVRAATLADAVASRAGHQTDSTGPVGADFIAGGTDLIQLLKENLRRPERVVDISGLPGLDRIESDGQALRLGALVRMSDAAAHPVISGRFPVIAQALLLSASAQVRNVATLGGNLLQRTRCGYFRDPGAPCNKREPRSGCPAIRGQNRLNAVLGVSDHCIATYAGDFANALVALDAQVRVAGPAGERALPVVDLHRPPGDTPWIETQLAPGELIVGIDVPLRFARWRSHYLKVRDRKSFEWSLASAAVALDLDGDRVVQDVRLAVGGVATRPWRLEAVEARLRGRRLTEDLAREASRAAADGAVEHGANAYKIELVRRTVARALRDAAHGPGAVA